MGPGLGLQVLQVVLSRTDQSACEAVVSFVQAGTDLQWKGRCDLIPGGRYQAKSVVTAQKPKKTRHLTVGAELRPSAESLI
jgi:hypothetical protein